MYYILQLGDYGVPKHVPTNDDIGIFLKFALIIYTYALYNILRTKYIL